MVPSPQISKKRGQPKSEVWEQWRVIAWANEVHRRIIEKMAMPSLPPNDKFEMPRMFILARWAKPQRQTQNPGVVALSDLDHIFTAGQKSSFYKYTKGQNARLRKELLESVEEVLPGTRFIYDIGFKGIPIWAALGGKITTDGFWLPLFKNGGVSDLLELDSGWFDWHEEGMRNPPPKSNKDNAIDIYLATAVMPTVPLDSIVLALSARFAAYREPDMPVTADRIQVDEVTLGEATLVIAMAQLALYDPRASLRIRKNLQKMLSGCVLFWKTIDAESDEPQSDIAGFVVGLAARL